MSRSCYLGLGLVFLVSFLNVGKRIASSAENFLIFGADADECSAISSRFIRKAMLEIKWLESQIHIISVAGKKDTVKE